jgi:hypothetical protein
VKKLAKLFLFPRPRDDLKNAHDHPFASPPKELLGVVLSRVAKVFECRLGVSSIRNLKLLKTTAPEGGSDEPDTMTASLSEADEMRRDQNGS